MKNKFIPQMEPWFGLEEKNAMMKYMDEGGWLTEFRRTVEFEQRIAEFTHSKYCFVVNNGTISLTLMAIAAGLKAGDEVIVPNYTMIATPNSIKMIGCVPVFVDVEPETLCMDIQCVKKVITPRTKAILFVNANGRYPKAGIENFKTLCLEKGLVLLEDSAQSLGSFYPNGKHQGSVGLAGSFSFSSPKIISTGQGGAIITNDDEMAYKLKRLKDFGRSGGGNDFHDTIGFNFKFTEMQAVIGNEQMKKLSWRIDRKKEIYLKYKNLLEGIDQVELFDNNLEYSTPWFIDVLVKNRNDLQIYLKDNGVGTRIMYPPINKQIAYNTLDEFPVSNMIGEKGLWLPSAAQLEDNEIERVTNLIRSFYND
jgi:perosamine synthetase